MKRTILLSALLAANLLAVTLEEISDKPASRAKNFLIWQFLHQDINASEASEAFYQIDNVNERFFLDYAKKSDEPEVRYTAECIQKPADTLMGIEQDDCLMLALTPIKAESLQNSERETIAARLENRFGDVQWLRTMNQDEQLIAGSDIQASLKLFIIAGAAYREQHFNHPIDDETLIALTSFTGFNQFVYLTTTDPKLDRLQSSLANISGGAYDVQTHFYLAINAIKFGRNDNALFHLREAKNKANSPIERDKIIFWMYRITKNENVLKELAESLDINMYTLYAKELLGIETENYFTTLPTPRPGGFRGDDPFEWQKLHQEIMASTPETLGGLIDRYDGEDSLAVQAYMIGRMYEPYVHNFTMPYDQYMSGLTNDQKALTYALMRQETRLIPGLISRSFALGLMQLMPFNVDTIAKSNPYKITSYTDMFNPEPNIAYATVFLKDLERYLYNPVLIAYAYNGGMGFTKRMLFNGKPFLQGEHEPFMSMELIANAESREYGKRVLANYVIYKKILGEKISIISIFDNLIQPTLSDYFRASALNSLPAPSRIE